MVVGSGVPVTTGIGAKLRKPLAPVSPGPFVAAPLIVFMVSTFWLSVGLTTVKAPAYRVVPSVISAGIPNCVPGRPIDPTNVATPFIVFTVIGCFHL